MTAALPRVIHLASAREWRGGQRQVLLLARALARRGIDQLVITTERSRLADELEEARVPVRPVAWHRGLAWAPFRAAVREARLTRALFHAHDSHALVVASLAAPLARDTPFVATRRTDYPLRRLSFWGRAHRVMAISNAVRRTLVASGVPPERIDVVPDGIDVGATSRVTPAVRRELDLPADGPLAVHVGALSADKDQATLIRAAAILHRSRPDLHWAIAGTGPLRDQLGSLARDLGVETVIHFVGHLLDPLPLIAAGDLFVMSSAHEGLGTSILDAMALGRPIVATDAGGIPDLLGGGAGLLAPTGAPDQLAAAVAQVLTDTALRSRMVASVLQRAPAFSDDGMATAVLQVYRSVAYNVDAE